MHFANVVNKILEDILRATWNVILQKRICEDLLSIIEIFILEVRKDFLVNNAFSNLIKYYINLKRDYDSLKIEIWSTIVWDSKLNWNGCLHKKTTTKKLMLFSSSSVDQSKLKLTSYLVYDTIQGICNN